MKELWRQTRNKWLAAKADEFLLEIYFLAFSAMVHFHFRFKRPIEAAAQNGLSGDFTCQLSRSRHRCFAIPSVSKLKLNKICFIFQSEKRNNLKLFLIRNDKTQ